jgi:hypothetical protein
MSTINNTLKGLKMNKTLMLVLAASSLAPAVVAAQSFDYTGAELSYTIQDSDEEYTAETLRLSMEARILGQVATQLDFFQSGYDGDADYTGYALHLGYAPTQVSGLVVAAFYNEEDWEGDFYVTQGLEASYTTGAFTGEIAFGQYEERDEPTPSDDFEFGRLDLTYQVLDGVALLANYTSTEGDETLEVIGFGARVDLNESLYAEITSSNMSGDYEQSIVGVAIGYKIGSGTTFGARDWNGLLTIY